LNIPVHVTWEHYGNNFAMSIYCSVSGIKYWVCNQFITMFKTHGDGAMSLTKSVV